MLRLLHHILSRNRMTSRIQRHIVHRVKDLVNMPDGYFSMGQIYRKIKPAAILDIGAHHGYTVDKLLDYMPGAKIHAFEPSPHSATVLRRRMHRRPNVHVHEIALGDTTGTVRFHLNVGEQTNSLLDNLPSGQSPYDPVQRHLSQVQVQAMTLDDWAAKFEPNGRLLIKADIQGAERLLVAGGKKTFARRVAAFYTEICILPQYENQTSLCDLNQTMVEELGFALFEIYPCAKDELGRAAFTDVMWVKPAVLPLGG
jgi:FkbM family methyltransferase